MYHKWRTGKAAKKEWAKFDADRVKTSRAALRKQIRVAALDAASIDAAAARKAAAAKKAAAAA